MEHMISQASTVYAFIKKCTVVFLTLSMSFFAPIKLLLIGALILVILDWITGVRASKKRGVKMKSVSLYRTIVKFKDYSILIMASHLMTKIFFTDAGIDFAKVAAGYIAFVEFKSYCENMKIITGNEIWDKIFEILPNINIFKKKDANP